MLQSQDNPKIDCPVCDGEMDKIVYVIGDSDEPAMICYDCNVEYDRDEVCEIIYEREHPDII